MNKLLLGACITVIASLLSNALAADVYKVGDSFVGFSAPDQHGNDVTIKPDTTKFILFDTPDASASQSKPEDPDWFAKNDALLVVNISDFSGFTSRIARSRMKSKPFKLLVVGEKEVAAKFPIEKGKFTVLMLNDKGSITNISFATPGPETKKLVADAKK